MTIRVDNFFAGLPASSEQEQFLTLFKSESIKIERIVSHSHSSPPGFWYDQPENEWVIVLRACRAGIGKRRIGQNERGRPCADPEPQ
jgi:hypothetical protein